MSGPAMALRGMYDLAACAVYSYQRSRVCTHPRRRTGGGRDRSRLCAKPGLRGALVASQAGVLRSPSRAHYIKRKRLGRSYCIDTTFFFLYAESIVYLQNQAFASVTALHVSG